MMLLAFDLCEHTYVSNVIPLQLLLPWRESAGPASSEPPGYFYLVGEAWEI